MNHEKAIEVIKSNYPPSKYSMLCEALNMAIEALKKDNNMNEMERICKEDIILFDTLKNIENEIKESKNKIRKLQGETK